MFKPVRLTRAEKRVFELLLHGLLNKEIADRLSVSESTVKFHAASCYRKLNVKGRIALLGYDVTITPRASALLEGAYV